MNTTMFIVLIMIALFVSLLCVYLSKRSRKALLIVLCGCFVLVGGMFFTTFKTNSQEYIFLCGITKHKINESHTFSYDVKHKRVFMSGVEYEAKINIDKNELFEDVKNKKEVFDENINSLHIIENGEVFSLTNKGENIYSFKCSYIRLKDASLLPFPDYMMKKYKQYYKYDTPYEVNCDFSYLKDFFMIYDKADVSNE